MNHYRIIDISVDEAVSITEPVTLSEVKKWLKITFTDDDSVVTDLITECREEIEEFCTLSLVDKSIVLIANLNQPNNRECIEFELPYGPLKVIASVPDLLVELWNSSSWEIRTINVDYELIGSKFYRFSSTVPGRYRFTYTAGYVTVPDSLKGAIKVDIADRYENRGDEAKSPMSEIAKKKAQPFKRMTWL